MTVTKLPNYIEETNKKHNDGILITPFENKSILEKCQKRPYFNFKLFETKYSEKDRIIENYFFEVCLEIMPNQIKTNNIIIFCRYHESFEKMFMENKSLIEIKINNIKYNKYYIRMKFLLNV